MLKKIIIALIALLVIAAISLFVFLPNSPDLKAYEFLKQPRLTTLPDQKMLVVTAAGDPNTVGNKAFGLLFKTFYKIPDVPTRTRQAPRARWVGDNMNTKSSWTGYYALPVPAQTQKLPDLQAEPGLKIELTTWPYGEVAEILHIGPYAEETTAIDLLHRFIQNQGYRIIGEHEEEYIKGPGMFFAGDPKGYYTIIRYRVTKP